VQAGVEAELLLGESAAGAQLQDCSAERVVLGVRFQCGHVGVERLPACLRSRPTLFLSGCTLVHAAASGKPRRQHPDRPARFRAKGFGLLHLLRDEPGLAETLAAFLDAAGDVKSAAAALSLHRSGLYYRLQRIEELTGLDLSRGDDRLLAHLAIRVGAPVRMS
jgi:hypothetical protein